MRDAHQGAVAVTDEQGRLLGIFCDRDAVYRVLAGTREVDRLTLAEAMTKDPGCLSPGSTAMDALRLMQDGGFHHVPVVDGERVVGIVSYIEFLGLEHTRLEDETETFETMR
jgi:CBS domain-containing protein